MSLPLSDMCRFCMAKDDEVVYIFCEDALTDIINGCLPIKINMNDDLPKTMCSQCYECIDNFSRFRNLVLESEAKYNAFLSKSRIKSEVLSNLNIIESNMKHIVAGSQQNNVELIIGSNQSNYDLRNTVSFNNDDDLTQDMDDKMGINPMELVESDASDSGTANNHNDNSQDIEFTPRGIETVYVTASQPGTSGMQPSEIVEGLRQIKGLIITKTTSEASSLVTSVWSQSNKTTGSSNGSVEIADLSEKLSRTEVVIKKVNLGTSNMDFLSKDIIAEYINEEEEPNDLTEDEYADPKYLVDSDEDPSDDYVPSNRKKKTRRCSTAIETKPDKPSRQRITPAATPKPKRKATAVEIKTSSAYVCLTCQHQFPSYQDLKDHMKTNEHCKNANLTCDTCHKTYETKKALYQHSLTHREKMKYICDECGKTYSNKFNLENHKAALHGDHVEEFGSVYKCKGCNHTFVNRKDLNEHINQHTKEQVHLCDTCGKCFSTIDNLRSHLRTHSDIRPFPCDSCEKKFRTRLALLQHSHRHTGIKPFVCDVCGKSFAKKGSLNTHARLHTGEIITYQCHICLEQFGTSSKLKTHIKFHPQ